MIGRMGLRRQETRKRKRKKALNSKHEILNGRNGERGAEEKLKVES